MAMAMAIVSYVSANSTTTPLSQDSSSSSSSSPSPRKTKVILPKKKPLKWSTGDAPGEYGGPPTTTKLRKYWGGEGEDPLTSDDFIWNKDFMPRMKRLLRNDPVDPQTSPVKEESSGFLSLNRVMTLDRQVFRYSVEVDLSKELAQRPKPVIEQPVVATTKVRSGSSPNWRLAPTRREQDKWDKATKATTSGSDPLRSEVSAIVFLEVMFRELRQPRGDPEVLAAQSREQYFKLKKKLQIFTLGIGSVGLVSAYVSYSPEIAVSFGAGFIGSLVYIRMLGNSVDSMADGAKGLVRGAAAQPRLLVPVLLVMIYNRWNGILVPDYGFMHLELIPMLVGFFSYKIATFVQAIEEALAPLVKKT
uniref:CGL160/ATPI domain-containing protein n=1 Tax=Salix viminalis TaxID=40686 RepID=A0A6N2MD56_SALVM